MYSASDFEKLWFLYKTEGELKGIFKIKNFATCWLGIVSC